jgi:hypothetical protein
LGTPDLRRIAIGGVATGPVPFRTKTCYKWRVKMRAFMPMPIVLAGPIRHECEVPGGRTARFVSPRPWILEDYEKPLYDEARLDMLLS